VIAEPKLIEAACAGDANAVEKLLVVCQPDLRRFARRACSTSEDAEDAVQIALWQLYRKAEQLGISPEAVKSRLHRARSMMREHLLAGGYLASTT
jgi:DNA-directed RNA polymerase specialized sigma24 family protein